MSMLQALIAAKLSGSGGSSESGTLLGNTPLKLASASSVMLRTNSSATYSVKSDTKAVFNPASGSTASAMVSQENGEYVLKAGDGATDWYQSYVDVVVGGLAVGEVYNFVFDANGVTTDDSTHQTVGHYILYDSDGGTLVTRGATDGARKNVYAFTATTESVKLRWYPATNNTFVSGTSTARTKRIYINAANTSDYSAVVDLAGSFSGETMLRSLPAGVTIEATPSCAVYAIAEESEATKPLLGKTVVVFGDSLIGMVRDNTSATAEIAERTGATVYNVGFGGCRMSDHPSHGYAEFSMWALAKAIADNDWTAQETYVSQGSDYFPEQLAVLKGIDFSEVDYVVIHYGTNDFGGGVVIGESSAANYHSTLCGALRYSIETLLGSYPKLRIFISLPCFRFWTVDGQTVFSDTYKNAQNKTLPAYVEAMRSVAREYKLPVIGNYFGNGIDKVNATTYLSDGTHHTTLGRERFGSYIAEQLISGGGGGGGATSLNYLSDVTISEPKSNQVLVYNTGGEFLINKYFELGQLANVHITERKAGKALLCRDETGAGSYYFDFPQCAESPNYDAATEQAVEQIITLLKQSAKTSGKAGTKVSVDAAGMLAPLVKIADTRKRIPIATFGDYTFYPKGRISPSKMLFSCADTDADGFYDINVAIDGTASAVYVTVEYTACPAMG